MFQHNTRKRVNTFIVVVFLSLHEVLMLFLLNRKGKNDVENGEKEKKLNNSL